jgi:hypothetical protein
VAVDEFARAELDDTGSQQKRRVVETRRRGGGDLEAGDRKRVAVLAGDELGEEDGRARRRHEL